MLLEDQRYVQEDLERLEQGITDRMSHEPTFVRICVRATAAIFSSYIKKKKKKNVLTLTFIMPYRYETA